MTLANILAILLCSVLSHATERITQIPVGISDAGSGSISSQADNSAFGIPQGYEACGESPKGNVRWVENPEVQSSLDDYTILYSDFSIVTYSQIERGSTITMMRSPRLLRSWSGWLDNVEESEIGNPEDELDKQELLRRLKLRRRSRVRGEKFGPDHAIYENSDFGSSLPQHFDLSQTGQTELSSSTDNLLPFCVSGPLYAGSLEEISRIPGFPKKTVRFADELEYSQYHESDLVLSDQDTGIGEEALSESNLGNGKKFDVILRKPVSELLLAPRGFELQVQSGKNVLGSLYVDTASNTLRMTETSSLDLKSSSEDFILTREGFLRHEKSQLFVGDFFTQYPKSLYLRATPVKMLHLTQEQSQLPLEQLQYVVEQFEIDRFGSLHSKVRARWTPLICKTAEGIYQVYYNFRRAYKGEDCRAVQLTIIGRSKKDKDCSIM
ncbi:hypothetical protein NEOLI_000908 [Neolecta irregularis DAH-3]|uniref:Uncharacterized protein n=1 Tax=Neolecta irregularis (strain DAH-3) TaxID=1198029 RepID=A0A1U7LUY0_NEOID|nr:hypothetical protein NEOLI_000908 [Neolecta irregularis DAH-3]|eukprot:OLL26352.1 hypothetical protein NEOLI_000908 [Neolecta irregularis DAH-3]